MPRSWKDPREIIAEKNAEIARLMRELDVALNAVVKIGDCYQRDCLGLNNEGDPIGGDPPIGWKKRAELAEAELAAERELADRLAAGLAQCDTDLFEAEDKFHVASFYISDKRMLDCVKSRVEWMNKAGYAARDLVAAHATRRNK